MNIIQLQKQFGTKTKCIRHLEKVRWNNHPVCPHCSGSSITPRKARKFFYHCNKCNKDFTVLFGTIFEASKLPLPKWFLLITMMLNARKGISSKELSRQLGVTYKTAWFSAMRVRCAMIEDFGQDLLEGIVEMDESYVGGKPRRRNLPFNKAGLSTLSTTQPKSKRGRGTKKVAVVGIVEREGKKRVVMEIPEKLNSKTMLSLLKKYVNTSKSIMMTDEARFYNQFEKQLQHLVIKHKESYAEGIIHTNTIEGFWSIIKNGIRGEYHVLSRKYLPFYLAEFSYKYNRRFNQNEAFDETIKRTTEDEKCLVRYKPRKNPDNIAYCKMDGQKPSKKQKFIPKLKRKCEVSDRTVPKRRRKSIRRKLKINKQKPKQLKKVA